MCYKQYTIGSCIIIFGTHLEQIYPVDFLSSLFFFAYIYIYVIYMHCFRSAHIFIVYNNVICTNSFNIVLYNGDIVLNYTAHFVYSPLNSYVYIHWILGFKYIYLYIYIYIYIL